MTRRRFWLYFGPLFLLMLLSELYSARILGYIVKPLLMPALMIYLYRRGRVSTGFGRLFLERIAWGLLFSWIGDILLLFGDQLLYFGAGLAFFLIAHLFYISAYIYSIWEPPTAGRHGAPFLRRRPWWTIPFLVVLVALYAYLYRDLGILRVPVFVYGTVILTMAALALNRKGAVSDKSFYLVFAGSLLFVFSDILIAIDRFSRPAGWSGPVIIASYLAAQYLIVEGALTECVTAG